MAESLRHTSRLGAIVVLTSCLCLGPAHAPAQTAPSAAATPEPTVRTVQDLLARLAGVGALRARFVESKRMTILRTPLVSSGELWFTRPGWVFRKVDKPEASTMLLRDGLLTLKDPSGKRVLDTSASPVLRAFVDGFVQVLSGDQAGLERSYGLLLEPLAEGAWRLRLAPKSAPLARYLASLVFEGNGSTITRMVLTETNGDASTTEFSAIQLLAAFPSAERDRLFAAPR